MSGAQSFVIPGQSLRRVRLDDRMVGSAWSDSDADYCLLAGILPTDLADTRGTQARSCFEQMESALQQPGMDFSHVVRTWLYLDDLLSWYGEFNEARTGFFKERGVFERLIPASTGIGASNPAGAALTCGALAIRPRHRGVRICEVDSPLQRPATEYRSSFSRAVEVACADHRLLSISGTASIASDRKSMFADDVVMQIHRTLDVVEAILGGSYQQIQTVLTDVVVDATSLHMQTPTRCTAGRRSNVLCRGKPLPTVTTSLRQLTWAANPLRRGRADLTVRSPGRMRETVGSPTVVRQARGEANTGPFRPDNHHSALDATHLQKNIDTESVLPLS